MNRLIKIKKSDYGARARFRCICTVSLTTTLINRLHGESCFDCFLEGYGGVIEKLSRSLYVSEELVLVAHLLTELFRDAVIGVLLNLLISEIFLCSDEDFRALSRSEVA